MVHCTAAALCLTSPFGSLRSLECTCSKLLPHSSAQDDRFTKRCIHRPNPCKIPTWNTEGKLSSPCISCCVLLATCIFLVGAENLFSYFQILCVSLHVLQHAFYQVDTLPQCLQIDIMRKDPDSPAQQEKEVCLSVLLRHTLDLPTFNKL